MRKKMIFQTKAKASLLSWIFFMVGGLLVVVAALAAKSDSAGLNLTILHTNDLHSHDESFVEREHSMGGMPRIGHMLRLLRAKDPKHTLTIDAGDIFQGTPLFTKYHGEVEVNMLNKMGYDIYTIGNHEFDDGPKNLATQLKLAKFDIVNCNMDLADEPELAALVKPSVVKDIDGQKVAFIGGITSELNSVALNTGGIKIKSAGANWVQPFVDEVNKLKASGINKIILVTHCGVESDKILAQAIPEVDAIIGGHSHTRLDKAIVVDHPDGSSTTIVQTGCYGRALGKLDLVFDQRGRVVPSGTNYRLINITDKIFQDADLKAYVDEKVKPLLGLRKEIAGQATEAFDNQFRNYPWDSALGDLITDSLVEEGKDYGVQIGFENRGGIRSRIEKGPITAEKIEELLPFDNRVVFATVSGAVVLKTLEHSFSGPLGGSFLDEHGIKVGYDPTKPKGSRVVFALVADSKGVWKEIDAKGKYKISINDYSFKSGEGYNFEGAEDIRYVPERISVAFRHLLDKHHQVSPQSPSRIVPITPDLIRLEKQGGELTLLVKGLPAGWKVTIVEGTSKGVEALGNIPVPLSNPRILESNLKASADGTLTVKLGKRGKTATKKERHWLCIYARPTATAPSKKTLISNPISMDNN